MTSIFHLSDLHFGWPAVPEQIEAIERIIQESKFDVVAISGDLTQRARAGEFQRAAAFIRDARKVSRVITVPGNHDVKWWRAPLGFGVKSKVYENYRKFIPLPAAKTGYGRLRKGAVAAKAGASRRVLLLLRRSRDQSPDRAVCPRHDVRCEPGLIGQ